MDTTPTRSTERPADQNVLSFKNRPSIQEHTCPLCRRTRFSLFQKLHHLGVDLQYLICRHCGLVFLSPRFDELSLREFYQAEYRVLNSGDEGPTKEDLRVQQARAGHLARVVKSQVREVRSHLDIGCSAGELLSAIRAAYCDVANFKSVGIELSRAHRSWCEQRGLLVYPTVEDFLAGGAREFDLVTLSHVLEHLVDPVGFLRDLRLKVVSSTGFLLLEVPNLFGHGCLEVAHTLAFCERTLKEMLHVSGFCPVLAKLHSIPYAGSSGLRYITALAAPAGCANGSHLEARRVWWRMVKWRRMQWSLGLGSCWSHLVVRLPRKAGRSLYRRLRQQK